MGAHKTFQEILDEQLKDPSTFRSEAEEAKSKETVTPGTSSFAVDFSIFGAPLFKPNWNKKTHSYPRSPAPKANRSAQAAAVRPSRPDRFLPVEKLSTQEQAALKTLNLSMASSLSERALKFQYRSLVRKFHPDRHPKGLSGDERALMTERFHKIREAYQVLNEAFQRQIPTQQ